MKNAVTIAIFAVLAIGIIANGYFYVQQGQRLDSAQARITTLQENAVVLADSIAALSGTTSNLTVGVSALANDISGLRNDVSGVRGDISGLSRDTSALRGDVAGLKTDASALNSGVSTMQASIGGLRSEVAANARAFQSYSSAGIDTVSKLAPVLVRIVVSGPGFQGSGSGTLVGRKGYVLTSQHVVANAGLITITTMNGQQYSGSVASSDSILDLALVKINAAIDFPEVTLGSPADVIVGREVLAIGYALGSGFAGSPTVTRGIISATRAFQGSPYIQTDAAINPGNSGGCLVTLDGKLIGVPTGRIISDVAQIELIGLATPIDQVLPFVRKTVSP